MGTVVVIPIVTIAILAIGASNNARFEHLGLNVHITAEGLVVSRVIDDGPAARAGLRVGARIVAVRGVPVTTLEQLQRLLDPTRGVTAVELTIEEDRHPPTTPTGYRIALLTIGHQYTSTADVRSAWVGLYGGYAVRPGIWALIGFGYIAVGPRPGFGKDGFTPLAGLEYESRLPWSWVTTFVRGFVGVNLARGAGVPGAAGAIQPISALVHLGLRFGGFLEISLAGGYGPAENLNLGMGAAVGVTAAGF